MDELAVKVYNEKQRSGFLALKALLTDDVLVSETLASLSPSLPPLSL